MPNRTEARAAKASAYEATGRLPLLRLVSTPLIHFGRCELVEQRCHNLVAARGALR